MLESPRDKILWDVGHQSYPHKILTGRREQLSTIRQYEGLAPFCSIEESEHDIMGAGHASTSIGYAVGLKEAMRKGIGVDGRVAAVIGDGALTGGVAYEALHAAGGLQTPIVIVLNDNGMSISPNVGALSRYFNRIRLNPRLYHAREDFEDRLTKLPLGVGRQIERLGPEIKAAIKAYWAPGLFFEELDLAYMGVIDGHDVAALRRRADRGLRGRTAGRRPHPHGQGQGLRARRSERPRLDGGVARGEAELDRQRPADNRAKSRRRSRSRCRKPTRRRGSSGWRSRPRPARRRSTRRSSPTRWSPRPSATSRVIGITAAMAGGTGLQKLADERPEQYYDVGIAEQNAILLASGLALQGAKPVAAIYSTFLQRAFDQIVHDVCLQELDVTFAMDRAGLVGDDGPTHHGAFDISYFRPIPNVVLMAPRDEAMLVHMLHTAIAHDGPAALRYPRGAAEGVAIPAEPELLPIGKGEVLTEGRGVALLGYGYGVDGGAGGGGDPRRPRHPGDGRRRPLRQAARRGAGGAPGARPRPAGDDRGERPAGRLRRRRAGAPRGRLRGRDRGSGRGSCGSACRTATSPTASRICCAPRSASPASRWPIGCSRATPRPRRPIARLINIWVLRLLAQSNRLPFVSSVKGRSTCTQDASGGSPQGEEDAYLNMCGSVWGNGLLATREPQAARVARRISPARRARIRASPGSRRGSSARTA